MIRVLQGRLFPEDEIVSQIEDATSSTFVNNMTLPVHRWFRYSAGFSAEWAASVIRSSASDRPTRVFDPFAGSGTTLLAAESVGVGSIGTDAHPFVTRVARAKLAWRSDPQSYLDKTGKIERLAATLTPKLSGYPSLIRRCYSDETLERLDTLKQAIGAEGDDSPASELAWLTLVAILRRVSRVGTAQWQYVLPNKAKRDPIDPLLAWRDARRTIYQDMTLPRTILGPAPLLLQADARTCDGVPSDSADLVVTSPPYPNNYDYADATRLEMTFMGDIGGWGDLQHAVRRHLIRSCSQHVPERSVDLEEVLDDPDLDPIRDNLSTVCQELAEVRKTKGGKKTYHLMVACYFRDLAKVWISLRRVCGSPSKVCFVVGDSAPYGVYVPVIPWLGTLALTAGFHVYDFEKTRDRNVKWKNRKHRVPLQEGRLWVMG